MKLLNPENWPKPKGYSNGIEAEGKLVFVAGQIGWDENEKIVSTKLSMQVAQCLKNVLSVMKISGAGPEHIVRMTWYVTDKAEYISERSEIGSAYREIIGQNYPAMSLLEVSGLLEEGAKVEIEATAVIAK